MRNDVRLIFAQHSAATIAPPVTLRVDRNAPPTANSVDLNELVRGGLSVRDATSVKTMTVEKERYARLHAGKCRR